MSKRILAALMALTMAFSCLAMPSAAQEATPAPSEKPVSTGESAEPTPAPTAQPEATPAPTEEPAPEEEESEGDLQKMAGSSGVLYSGVEYISVSAYNALDAENKALYTKLADEIAGYLDNGMELIDAVLYVDENGDVYDYVSIPYAYLEEVQAEQAQALMKKEGVATGENAEKLPLNENEELVNSIALASADSLGTATYDSILPYETFFRTQLSSSAQAVYDIAKSSLVNSGRNTFTTSSSYSSIDAANAVSALINTYPQKFNWRGRGSTGTLSWSTGGGFTNWTMGVSPHYSSSLETQANSKVTSLVTAAYNYAASSYPNNPTYGIVKYFDKWICENNYYNYNGTYEYYADTAEYFYCHNAYGILFKGYGVCESYALAMSRLLDAAGVPNFYVVGDSGGGHAWDYVKMPNGKYYLLDSTWNDSGSYSSENYLLVPNDGRHTPNGMAYTIGMSFKFVNLSSTKYPVDTENLAISSTSVTLSKGNTNALTLGAYWSKFKKTWSSNNTKVATVSSSGVVTAVGPGTAYITVKIAGKATGCKVTVSGSTPTPTPAPTPTPSSTTASITKLTNVGSGIQITWSQVRGASGYKLYRKSSSDKDYVPIKSVSGGGTLTTINSGVENSRTYSYKIAAMYGTVIGKPSTAKSIVRLTAPTVTAVKNASGGIQVTWTKVGGATGYKIFRKASGQSTYTVVKSVTGGSTLSVVAPAATAGTIYTYAVAATNGSTTGLQSSGKGVRRLVAPVISSITNVNNGIQLRWTKTTAATGYVIYRKASYESSYSVYKVISGSNNLSYINTSVSSGTNYSYTVASSCNGVYSAQSSARSITRQGYAPATPVITSCYQNKSCNIYLSWNKISNASGYILNDGYTTFDFNPNASFSNHRYIFEHCTCNHNLLTYGRTYYMRLRAYRIVNGVRYYSNWSPTRTVRVTY